MSRDDLEFSGGCGCLTIVGLPLVVVLILGLMGYQGGCSKPKQVCFTTPPSPVQITAEQARDLRETGAAEYKAPEPVRECHTFKQYGFANLEERNPKVRYEVSMGNVVWSAILCETVVAPIVLLGWYLYEPVGNQDSNAIPGAVN